MADFNERLLKYNQELFFGQWRLDGDSPEDALLGKGSFGRVYSVFREEDDGFGSLIRYKAAIKFIAIDENIEQVKQKSTAAEKQAFLNSELKYVQNEIEIMKRLEGESNIAYFQNSKIIKRTDTDLDCWDVLICMEKLVVLGDHLRDEKASRNSQAYLMRILYMWKDLSAALSVCERAAILHADVKPQNVFYAPNTDRYKLSDFGTSIRGNTFKSGIRFGTNFYMSPEMYHKKGGDSRSDIYSLAVMIYELLNGGNLPLQHGTDRDQAWKMRLEELKQVPPIKGIPDDVNRILLRCLDSDPKRRYARCNDLADEVMELYLSYRKQGHEPGRSRRKPWVIPVVAGTLAVSLIGVGAGILINSGKPSKDAVEAVEVNAQADALKMTLDESEIRYESGKKFSIKGSFTILDKNIRPEDMLLFVDEYGWYMTIWEADGYYIFSADIQMNDAIKPNMEVSLRSMDGKRIYASEQASFMEDSEPEATHTPEPAPQQETEVSLDLKITNPVVWQENGVVVEGEIAASEPVDPDQLHIWVNDAEWKLNSLRESADCRYAFAAGGDVQNGTDILKLQVKLVSDGNEICSPAAEVELKYPEPVSTPSPEPAPAIEFETVDAVTGEDGVARIKGIIASDSSIDPDKLEIWVNSEKVGKVSAWEESTGRYGFEFDRYVGAVSESIRILAQLELDDHRRISTPNLDLTIPASEAQEDVELTLKLDVESVEASDETILIPGKLALNKHVKAWELGILVNGKHVAVEWHETEGGYMFIASMERGAAAGEILEVKARYGQNDSAVEDSAFLHVLGPTPEPTPEPTAVPVPEIRSQQVEWSGNVALIQGRVFVAGDVSPDDITIRIQGQARKNGIIRAIGNQEYEFSIPWEAENHISNLPVQAVLFEGTDQESVSVIRNLQMVIPVSVSGIRLIMDDETLEARNGEFLLEGMLFIDANIIPDEHITLYVDDREVDADWTFGAETYNFAIRTDLQLEGKESLSVRAAYAKDGDFAEQTVVIPLVQPEFDVQKMAEVKLDMNSGITEGWIAAGESLQIEGLAEPNQVLEISMNGSPMGSMAVGTDGTFELDIPQAYLVDGENVVKFEYVDEAGLNTGVGGVLNAVYDNAAPFFHVQQEIDGSTIRLEVEIADMDPACRVLLNVEGKGSIEGVLTVTRLDAEENIYHCIAVLDGIDELNPESGDTIEVIVGDGAGNAGSRQLIFKNNPRNIELLNADQFGENQVDMNSDLRLVIRSSPNAELMLWVNGEPSMAFTNAQDLIELDVRSILRPGKNEIRIAYTQNNDFEPSAMENADAFITIHCAPDYR